MIAPLFTCISVLLLMASIGAAAELPEIVTLPATVLAEGRLRLAARVQDYVYRDGPAPQRTGDREFRGGVVVEDGSIVMIPRTGQFIGVLDLISGQLSQTARHGQPGGFGMGSVVNGHLVVMTPRGSRRVGLYDARTRPYRDGAAHGQASDNAFLGSAQVAPDLIVFGPLNAEVIGLYDPTTDRYRDGPRVDAEGPFRFSLIAWSKRTGLVICVPFDSQRVGLYAPVTNTYRAGAAHDAGTNNAYSGTAETPDGRFVMAPRNATHIGIYDPATDTFSKGPIHGEGPGAFMAVASMPDGLMLMAPFRSEHVGIYDPITGEYRSGPSVARVPGVRIGRFSGAIPVGDTLIMTNRAADTIGIVERERFFAEHGTAALTFRYRVEGGPWQETDPIQISEPGVVITELSDLDTTLGFEIESILRDGEREQRGRVRRLQASAP